MLQISAIAAFNDNYIWCLHRGDQAVLVDPGDAAPAEAALAAKGLQLSAVLITHHHPDHVGGLPALCEGRPGLPVYGPQNDCPHINHRLVDGDGVAALGSRFTVIAVPGHTLDHIAYFSAQGANEVPLLFCGDTLFAGGCGRLFEGTPEQMLHSLSRLSELPPQTLVYCAHEYTLRNLDFALAAEPDNLALQTRLTEARATRAAGQATVPSELALELATNPFLRIHSVSLRDRVVAHAGLNSWTNTEIFANLRAWKDSF